MENKEIFDLLKGTAILYETKQEMYDIATTLTNLGFDIYTKLGNLGELDFEAYYYESSEQSFVRTRNPKRYTQKQITYKDFMFMLSKKHRKIERPDIDPLGEDDWGYEEIKETNKSLGFSWIEVDKVDYRELNEILRGKTITIYQNVKGKYVPFDRIKPKVVVKEFKSTWNKWLILITSENTEIEMKYDDRIKIIGNKMSYGDRWEIDPFNEEIWD
jgi:hypothetical protein